MDKKYSSGNHNLSSNYDLFSYTLNTNESIIWAFKYANIYNRSVHKKNKRRINLWIEIKKTR